MKSVAMVFRKPLPVGQYSIESLFDFVHQKLKDQIEVDKVTLPFNGTNPLRIFGNIFFAGRLKHKVIHITGDVHYALLFAWKRKTIVTIHDCTCLTRKKGLQQFVLKWLWFKLPVKFAHHVVAISEATANDITKHTGYPREKMKIIPSFSVKSFPYRERFFREEIVQVLVFSQSENKNLNRFIKATKDLDVHLIIIGELQDAQRRELNENTTSYENVARATDEELFSIYDRSQILLFASTKEGFGMPIIEAQQQGLPVITSNCSSMPEVAGDGAFLVDPFSVESIKEGLQKVISDNTLRERIVSKGQENAVCYEPGNIAKMYLELYQSCFEKEP